MSYVPPAPRNCSNSANSACLAPTKRSRVPSAAGEFHDHPRRLAGERSVVAPLPAAPAAVVADVSGLQPRGQAVLGGWIQQAIGDQREGALGEVVPAGVAGALAETAQDAVEVQLVPERAQDQQRAPVPGLHGTVLGVLRGGRALAGEQFVEAGGMGFEQVDPPEAANHALAVFGSAVGLALAIGFLQPEVLAGSAVGGADSDFAEEHGPDFRCVITIVIQTRSLSQEEKRTKSTEINALCHHIT